MHRFSPSREEMVTMRKRMIKAAACTVLLGSVLQFGGCFADSVWGRLLDNAALSAGYDYLWDRDGVLNLFTNDANHLADR
jgi:hypothetical protein